MVLSLVQTGLQAQFDVTGTVCLLLGDSKKKSAVDILYNGTSQATRASPRREHPLFVQAERLVLHTSLSEAVWLTADLLRCPDLERSVHIPTH